MRAHEDHGDDDVTTGAGQEGAGAVPKGGGPRPRRPRCATAACAAVAVVRGLCGQHLLADDRRRLGDVDPLAATCEAAACTSAVAEHGLCPRHAGQRRRHGRLLDEAEVPRCGVASCARDAVERGWCHAHYLRWTRSGDVQADVPLRSKEVQPCTVEGCTRGRQARGLCGTHYTRWRTRGDVDAARPVRKQPDGEGWITHGYLVVMVPPELQALTSGRTQESEHRLVMALHLGRPLRGKETVHHRNGDRLDNRIENLELWSTYQPKGQAVSDKVAYALDVLRVYAPHRLADR